MSDIAALWSVCLASALAGALALIARELFGEAAVPPPLDATARQRWLWRWRSLILAALGALPAIAWAATALALHGTISREWAEIGSIAAGVLGPAWLIDRLRAWVEKRTA